MDRKAIQAGEISTEIAKFLETARREQGVSYRDLESRIGINYMRAQRILKAERPFTVDEVNLISAALGFVGWKVVRDAAREIRPILSLVPEPGERSPMPTADELSGSQTGDDMTGSLWDEVRAADEQEVTPDQELEERNQTP